jgi:UDP-2,3-diacylglucosamine pyrophosphatase LpxH
MGNRYLVVSDLHLVDVEEHADGWKSYKSERYLFDEAFDKLVSHFVDQAEGGDRLTLVLNGDIFDFDLITAVPENPPWPVSRFERSRGLRPTAAKSAWKMEHILSFHQPFVKTLARFVSLGNSLIFLLGNHDRELHFDQVRDVLVSAIEKAARADELSLLTGSVKFEPWFFYVPGEIYAEHGHQFDFYTSFRYQLAPTVEMDGERELALPMGNLSNRYLMSRMGFFNPHASDFILNVFSYVAHWVRHYLFSRRSLLLVWFFSSLQVIAMLLRIKKKLRAAPPVEHEKQVRKVARTYDLSNEAIAALSRLYPEPITSRMFRLFRELWLDRVIIALVMTGGTITLALVPIPLWIKLMVPLTCFPLVYFIYEELAHGETIFAIEKKIPEHARCVVELLPARVVAFGHTHIPRQIPLARDATFVDTGTWAPILNKDGSLKPGRRTYALVSFHRGDATVQLGSWMDSSGC